MFSLPRKATAPFCPAEVQGSIRIDAQAPWWQRLRRFAGPGLLVAVGYMDPGNWATDWPLLRMVASRQQMGEFVLSRGMQLLGWLMFVVICGANLLLIIGL